jgi:bifunctional lysine-specific demethylase and histidyl-hydroxylase NO66
VCAGITRPKADVTRRAGIGNRDLDDLIAPNQVVDRYRRGDTVVLQGLHHTDPALARLANNLALALDQPVQINAYLSPASSRGLDLHFDYHDVFVVQLAGAKHWRVWAPLDRTTNPAKGRHTIAAPRLDELGPPLVDRTVAAGECLYVPRGFPHAAEAVDQASDHLTIGVTAVTWQRVVRRAVDAEVAAGRMTEPLPIGLLDPGAAPPEVAVDPDFVRRWVHPATLRHWLAREVWRRQPATRLRPRLVPEVGAEPLVVTPGPLLWLTTIADRAVLGLGDRVLDLPAEALDCLAAVLGAEGAFDAAALDDGLDDASRRVVLRRLVAEGVLVGAD